MLKQNISIIFKNFIRPVYERVWTMFWGQKGNFEDFPVGSDRKKGAL
jgi:hypothetical protein